MGDCWAHRRCEPPFRGALKAYPGSRHASPSALFLNRCTGVSTLSLLMSRAPPIPCSQHTLNLTRVPVVLANQAKVPEEAPVLGLSICSPVTVRGAPRPSNGNLSGHAQHSQNRVSEPLGADPERLLRSTQGLRRCPGPTTYHCYQPELGSARLFPDRSGSKFGGHVYHRPAQHPGEPFCRLNLEVVAQQATGTGVTCGPRLYKFNRIMVSGNRLRLEGTQTARQSSLLQGRDPPDSTECIG